SRHPDLSLPSRAVQPHVGRSLFSSRVSWVLLLERFDLSMIVGAERGRDAETEGVVADRAARRKTRFGPVTCVVARHAKPDLTCTPACSPLAVGCVTRRAGRVVSSAAVLLMTTSGFQLAAPRPA